MGVHLSIQQPWTARLSRAENVIHSPFLAAGVWWLTCSRANCFNSAVCLAHADTLDNEDLKSSLFLLIPLVDMHPGGTHIFFF